MATFSEKMTRLTQLTDQLEKEQLTLEQAIDVWTEAHQLGRELNDELDAMRARFEVKAVGQDGGPLTLSPEQRR